MFCLFKSFFLPEKRGFLDLSFRRHIPVSICQDSAYCAGGGGGGGLGWVVGILGLGYDKTTPND